MGKNRKRAFLYTIPFWALLLGYLLFRSFYFPLAEKPLWHYATRLPLVLVSSGTLIFSYLWLLIFPHPLHVERIHRLAKDVWSPQGLVFLILIGVLVVSFWALRRQREARFLLTAFFVSLLPVLNLVPIYPSMAEHYLYLPSIAIFLLVGRLLDQKWGRACLLLSCLLFVGYGTRTILRNQDYSDETLFFEKTKRYAPQSFIVHTDLGALYLARGRLVEAMSELKRALEIDPNRSGTLANLGAAYRGVGEYEKAITQYLKAIQVEPKAAFYNSLGVCYGMYGKTEEAEKTFQKAIALEPDAAEAYYNLGKLYWDQKRWSEVETIWRRGLEKDPKHPFLREWLEKFEKEKEKRQK